MKLKDRMETQREWEKAMPAAQVVARYSRKYKVNKVWLWDVLEEQFNIIKGLGCLMTYEERIEFEDYIRDEIFNS